jgi:hypothetical protein
MRTHSCWSTVEELKELHKTALKPILDAEEETNNEHAIEIQTRDITKVCAPCASLSV